ncbi:hypothetical protein ACED29_10255 [Shewanella sp. 5S214]|uniref:hypothetical protein n=1 Tax=unclassified Shewanella TaxID=196818 RepID=UPI001603A7D3|nr:hypothetical protein [Shewanella sp. SG41-3]MBB1474119.1 hypothetical protein [Shewanella sp. SG41-3]
MAQTAFTKVMGMYHTKFIFGKHLMIKYKLASLLICSALILFGCSEVIKNKYHADDLLDFAESNCIFWYFKSKDYDLSDIKKITSGIVELSNYSADKFQQTAILVKEYDPEVSSKENIDIELLKCFILKKDQQFLNKLDDIRKL